MKTNLTYKLDAMERVLQGWIDFDRAARDREGLTTESITHIMAPTGWPTHGMLAEWIKTLKEAKEDAMRR